MEGGKTRKTIVSTMLLFLFFTVNVVPVLGQGLIGDINLPSYELYAPARVVVSFAYTKNVSIHVSTLGSSLYKAVTSPVQVEFSTEAFDVYTITIQVLYDITVDQTVTVGLFEGGRAAKGLEFNIASTGFTITMQLSVIEAPHYPTADEISDLMWQRWRNELDEFEAGQRDLVSKMADTVTVTGSLAVISFVVCIVLIVAVFYIHRKVAELAAWGIRHEVEGR